MLTDTQKRLYARHILLDQLGLNGQARLCAARVRFAPAPDSRAPDSRAPDSRAPDSRASDVARDYLSRAGVQLDAAAAFDGDGDDDAAVHTVMAGSVDDVRQLAGDDALCECAAWLRGAFAAVEAIKQITGVGSAARLDPQLVLTSEVT